MDIRISLTEDERDFIACLIYYSVGGSPDGPRRFAPSIASKLRGANVNRFDVAIQPVNRYGNLAVVVEEPKEPRMVRKLCDVMDCDAQPEPEPEDKEAP